MEKIVENTTTNGLIKIAIVGPESTGKTTLAQKLAAHFNTCWVPEYARQYLNETNGEYEQSDLSEIAKGQINLEDQLAGESQKLLFCDTNLVVIKIWSEHRYHNCDQWIIREMLHRKYHLHILCDIDLPWMADPLREHPDLRKYFFEKYRTELTNLEVPFQVISGNGHDRLKNAINAVSNLR